MTGITFDRLSKIFLLKSDFFPEAVYTVIEFGFVFVLSVMAFYSVGENIQNSGATNVEPNRKKLYL